MYRLRNILWSGAIFIRHTGWGGAVNILILGGYGVFGGRLAELLADLGAAELILCGRNLARAQAFCAQYKGPARVRPLRLDRCDISRALGLESPDLVVDASGPFQNYGADRYVVI